jgi:hypothetical protein
MHRILIVVLLVAGGLGFLFYSGYRDFEQYKAARAAEQVVRSAAALGVAPQPIVIQVPSAPVVQPTGFFGRGGGSGQAFNRRQDADATTKPGEARQTDKTGAVTVVYCPTGEPTKATATDTKGVVTTTFACPPVPPPPPNVTRFDPPTDKDRKAIEALYPKTPLAKFDLLGTFDAKRTRTDRHYGIFLPASGGDIDVELHEDPRSTWAWGHHFELYGEAFRQQPFGVGSGGVAVGQPGYGAAAGAVLDAFRYKELHFQPLLEGGWAAGAGYLRIGVRAPLCVGAECP